MNSLHTSILSHTYLKLLFFDILFFCIFLFPPRFIGYKNGMEGEERGFLVRIKSRIVTIIFFNVCFCRRCSGLFIHFKKINIFLWRFSEILRGIPENLQKLLRERISQKTLRLWKYAPGSWLLKAENCRSVSYPYQKLFKKYSSALTLGTDNSYRTQRQRMNVYKNIRAN